MISRKQLEKLKETLWTHATFQLELRNPQNPSQPVYALLVLWSPDGVQFFPPLPPSGKLEQKFPLQVFRMILRGETGISGKPGIGGLVVILPKDGTEPSFKMGAAGDWHPSGNGEAQVTVKLSDAQNLLHFVLR
jgi:hypothetical protein